MKDLQRVNDVHGHLAGDEALRRVSGTILHEKRLEGIAGRYGGENKEIKLTMSGGIGAFSDQPPDVLTLIGQADAAVYQAKEQGKNRVL